MENNKEPSLEKKVHEEIVRLRTKKEVTYKVCRSGQRIIIQQWDKKMEQWKTFKEGWRVERDIDG